MPKTAMVFGTFDGLHAGHESFLKEAGKYGRLIIVVARDSAVKRIKKHPPRYGERIRSTRLRRMNIAARVVLGDRREGEYKVIRRYRPDVIVLGYDQKTLRSNLVKNMRSGGLPKCRLVSARPLDPRRLHSSLLNK